MIQTLINEKTTPPPKGSYKDNTPTRFGILRDSKSKTNSFNEFTFIKAICPTFWVTKSKKLRAVLLVYTHIYIKNAVFQRTRAFALFHYNKYPSIGHPEKKAKNTSIFLRKGATANNGLLVRCKSVKT